MMKILPKLIQVGVVFLLLLAGCQNDDELVTEDNSKMGEKPLPEEIQQISADFSIENFNDAYIREYLEVDWADFGKKADTVVNRVVYEFGTSVQGIIENDEHQMEYTYKVLASRNDVESWDFEVVKLLADVGTSVDHISYLSPGDFSGTSNHYDLEGENIGLTAFEEGKIIDKKDVKVLAAMNEWAQAQGKDLGLQATEPEVGGEEYMLIVVMSWTDWYISINGGSYNYSYSTYSGTSTQWVRKSGGTSGYSAVSGNTYHGHHGGSNAPPAEPSPHPYEILLDPSFENNDCLKNVYNKLKGGNNTISQYIENFIPGGSVANLTLKTDDNFKSNQTSQYWTAGAITSPPDHYMITITFNTDPNLSSSVGNLPSIILAVEFMHEIIHAEMYRKLLAYAQQPEIPWTREFIDGLRNNFNGLADYYTRWWLELPPDQAPTSAQHQLMAQHYINTMANALSDYDNNQHSQAFYKALSWIGLKNTVAWNNLSSTEQTNIEAQIQNAMQNGPCN